MTTFSRLLRQKIKENPEYEPTYVKKWAETELPEIKGIRRVLIARKNAENLQKIRSGRK
jgi:hypothetical protein